MKKKLKNKTYKHLQKAERFTMHQTDEDIAKVENLARKTGCTKSWVFRAVLKALEKKYTNGLPEEYEIKRPKRFDKDFRQTTICFYGDRQKWFSLCRIWKVELGPLIRFGLELYESGDLKLDLETSDTVKDIKKASRGTKQKIQNLKTKNNSYTYVYQNTNDCYNEQEFWLKNSELNRKLLERGLKNRLYPLILPENFKIPKAFGG